jgi:hypothetical protein
MVQGSITEVDPALPGPFYLLGSESFSVRPA